MKKFQNLHVDDNGDVHYMVDENCPFVKDLEKFQNGEDPLTVNGNKMPMAYWNLICSIRDVSLYLKGMKITRSWKITPVKKYFGFYERDNAMFLDYLQTLADAMKGDKKDEN